VESAELIAILRAVREQVRVRHPETAAPDIPLPDLMPLVHARDSAFGKVAAIGSVNPRRGGPLNLLAQAGKRLVSRALDWHVREQVEFNRKAVASMDATIEALTENNRTLSEIAGRLADVQGGAQVMQGELGDLRRHWSDWRPEWQRKLQDYEVQFLRALADLQGASQFRADIIEGRFRDALHAQHSEFAAGLERNSLEIQKRLWADLERIRLEYERLIFSELRTIRQRVQVTGTSRTAAGGSVPGDRSAAANPAPPAFDYGRFAERFRGSEDYVKRGQRMYAPYFAGCRNVLDIGCGRGEFLETMREAGVPARGIDLDEESVATCRHKGLEAEPADLYAYLADLPEASLDGIFCSQVVEHLPPERLPEMVRLSASRLTRNGVIAIETPDPECLAIFATHFYLDPTHTRPVPHALLAFYLEEFGVGNIQLHRLSPAVESIPALASLPEDFRNAFFGGLDYSIIGRKL
jgi:O-antigen chain-terminating methyltransferase